MSLKVCAVVDASRSVDAVSAVVVASSPTVVVTSVRRLPIRPLTQISAPNEIAATTSATMP